MAPDDESGAFFCAVRAVALAGTYSHVLLDSMMQADLKPFAPFSDANWLGSSVES